MHIWECSDGLGERPLWAKGAFVYLTPLHAAELLESIRESGTPLPLQTKHVVVSEEYMGTLTEVLHALPEGSGRELFLERRAGSIQSMTVLDLPLQSRHFPQFMLPSAKLLWNFDELDIGLELLGFVCSPPCVQRQQPELIVAAWSAVCQESLDPSTGEHWLQMKDAGGDLGRPSDHPTPSDPKCPFCIRCGTWAETAHLTSAKCRSIGNGDQPRPLLDAILEAADADAARFEVPGIVTGSAAIVLAATDADAQLCQCGFDRAACGACGRGWAQTDQQAARFEVLGVLSSFPGHYQRPPSDPERLKFRGRCPKLGCELRIGSRDSDTHCCKRCAAADFEGVDRLPRDPNPPYYRWKSRHGPECTMHQRERGGASSSFTGFDAAAPVFTPSVAGCSLAPSEWQFDAAAPVFTRSVAGCSLAPSEWQ